MDYLAVLEGISVEDVLEDAHCSMNMAPCRVAGPRCNRIRMQLYPDKIDHWKWLKSTVLPTSWA